MHVGRRGKKLSQSPPENDEGLNYRSSNGIREDRINWTDNSVVNKCEERRQREPKVTKDFLQ